jgi:hypothetical protein
MHEELGDGESDNESVLLADDCDRLRLKGPNRCVGGANDARAKDHAFSEVTKICQIMLCEFNAITLMILSLPGVRNSYLMDAAVQRYLTIQMIKDGDWGYMVKDNCHADLRVLT